ncbi:MAG: DNA polymerase III subunit alpha [Myxococcota bacterium]|nr:DNA polymerase III subunit alpha [Myxococcota bacterium]
MVRALLRFAMAEFAHLHLHTQYSMLEGAIRVDDLFQRVKELGMTHVAMTDHGNMFGVIHFHQKAKEHGITPIFGCGMWIAGPKGMEDRTSTIAWQLNMLAATSEGYRNLTYINSMSWLKGNYKVPRVDKAFLAGRTDGIIATSGCLRGEIPRHILNGDMDKARAAAREYQALFAPGCFYLEVQANGLDDQERVNDALCELAEELGLPLAATNNCLYLNQEDAPAHEVFRAIGEGKILDEGPITPETDAFFLRSPDEMERALAHLPSSAFHNAMEIASRCTVNLSLDKTLLPRFQVPEGYDINSYLREKAREGLEARLAAVNPLLMDREKYLARLEMELDVIINMGFAGYFLIVWDFIAASKRKGIPVGPGRGSGAGSMAAYALGITDIDPIPHDLLFERFLNPERVSMPDFDIDFCQDRRNEVIEYVTERYGNDNVGQIITYSQLKAKSVVRDVGRVLGVPYQEMNAIAKLIPEDPKMTIPLALEAENGLRDLIKDDPRLKRVIEIAERLEGLNRQSGIHAAGIVIGDQPLWNYVPVCTGNNGELVTQFAKDEVEKAGLVKFDFLGLKTLTVIEMALQYIEKSQPDKGRINLSAIPLDDAGVYRMISRGETAGVFQLESQGMTRMLTKLRPDCFEDLIAAVALYRPGPLGSGMVDAYIDVKHRRKPSVSIHPMIDDLLAATNGVIVYQEQVMRIVQVLGGFSLGGADLIRRAMGKKKKEIMEQEKEKFIAGCVRNGVSREKGGEVFNLIQKFAEYGFNKSHSAAYALITYQTAWLKKHFPVEFMTALLTSEKSDTSKIAFHVATIREMGIQVKPPDVNRSEENFSIEGGAIRFGLGAIKGVGESAITEILSRRREGGDFLGLYDFCERVDGRKVNKRVVEALCASGAFDFTKRPRQALFEAAGKAIARGQKLLKEKNSSQSSMFELSPDGPGGTRDADIDDVSKDEEWLERERLEHEFQSLGFYLTGHPLDRYQDQISRVATHRLGELGDNAVNGESFVAVVSRVEVREKAAKDKTGKWATVEVSDQTGLGEIVFYKKAWAKFESVVRQHQLLVVRGRINVESNDEGHVVAIRMSADDADPLEQALGAVIRNVQITIQAREITPATLQSLKNLLDEFPGVAASVIFIEMDNGARLNIAGPFIKFEDELLFRKLERILPGLKGKDRYSLN